MLSFFPSDFSAASPEAGGAAAQRQSSAASLLEFNQHLHRCCFLELESLQHSPAGLLLPGPCSPGSVCLPRANAWAQALGMLWAVNPEAFFTAEDGNPSAVLGTCCPARPLLCPQQLLPLLGHGNASDTPSRSPSVLGSCHLLLAALARSSLGGRCQLFAGSSVCLLPCFGSLSWSP